MLDIEEYAKAKGITVESIPVTLRKAASPKAESFQKLCNGTEKLLKACASESGDLSGTHFPAACMTDAAKHMECLINKRETAYQMAVKLTGKEACEKVFPYYEDNKKKALDMMEIYKTNTAGEKKDVFWG
mmetsp:Transcript_33265/g.37093  ORF Transcript_33265/g.37093 Transcript_33265/m.37093 type:complete len:130 (+) Transcript_33265:110-499(+)